MFEVDHIPVWIPDRDAALERLAQATGLPILEGYAPEGRRVARGIRFANGPFLDVHQSDGPGPVLLALSGEVVAAEHRAYDREWACKRPDAQDGEPWSILAFGPGQGVLSRLFVIEYAEDEASWRSPVFNAGLYHLPPVGGPPLRRVWLTVSDMDRAHDVLMTLDFWAAGDFESAVWPHRGQVFRRRGADIVLADGEDRVARFDVEMDGPRQTIDIGPNLTAVVGAD